MSTQNDPASLAAILNDLTNPEKEVRLAAIEATKQFGSRDAIPALQADVARATDTDEKIALLEAADFLPCRPWRMPCRLRLRLTNFRQFSYSGKKKRPANNT